MTRGQDIKPQLTPTGLFDWKATFNWYGRPVRSEILRLWGRGLGAAAIHATRRLKEVLSIPAPRKILKKGTRGVRQYVATKKATPGAPPRKLSGNLRRRVTWEMSQDKITARVGTNVFYGRILELRKAGGHQWLLKTIIGMKSELATIIGQFRWKGP